MNQLEQFREQCLNLVGSLDCAHRCGVGQEIADKIRALPLPEVGKQFELEVWYGPMPESNGKHNYTAWLKRKGGSWLDGDEYTFQRSEYPDRVRYEADFMRYLIGEIAERPDILDYDTDKHSGYIDVEAKTLGKEIDILKALNEHLLKENQSFYESDDHEFQAIYQDLIRDLGIPFGGSVIETVNKIQSQNARLMRTLHFVERCANHHRQNPKISAAEVLSMIQHYPEIEDITKSYADGVVPDTPNPYAGQEPVAYMANEPLGYGDNWILTTPSLNPGAIPLYKYPPDMEALRKENEQLKESLRYAIKESEAWAYECHGYEEIDTKEMKIAKELAR